MEIENNADPLDLGRSRLVVGCFPQFVSGKPPKTGVLKKGGVIDGTRTRNIQNHNLGLYH